MKKGDTYNAMIAGAYIRKIHIVEIIDEGLYHSKLVVYRYFGKEKRWWHYEIKGEDMLKFDIEQAEKHKDFPEITY